MAGESPVIGIDLGTTYTCAGVWQNNQVKLIPNLDAVGTYLFPSYVAFRDKDRIIGSSAKSQAIQNPERTIYSFKRLMGTRFSDENVQKDLKRWPFKVVQTTDNRPKISVQFNHTHKQFFPQELSSMVLGRVKKIAEEFLGCKINDTVITVPAYFNELQRKATIQAGEIAGLNVLHIMDEPTAAAVAFGMDMSNNCSNRGNVLVFDLGGGTFDVSVLDMKAGLFVVKAISGDTHLGGDDFDSCLIDYLVEEFKTAYSKDISKDAKALNKLKKICEEAKIILSNSTSTEICFEHRVLEDTRTLSRAFFERLNQTSFKKCIDIVRECLVDAKMDKRQIDHVLLVGGSTRIPKVKELLKDFFGNKDLCQTINPDEAVAHGAAIMAAKLSAQGSFGKELRVTGITPLSLGKNVTGGYMSVIIAKNTPIPVKIERSYVTAHDNQTEVRVGVYQGEKDLYKDNLLLGEFMLEGIPPAPKGVKGHDVCFEITTNGVLIVTAKAREGDYKNEITLINKEGISSTDEIEKLIKEAQKCNIEDEEYKRMCRARNSLESYAYQMSTKLEEMSSSPQSSKAIVKGAVKDAIDWVHKNKLPSTSESEAKLHELEKVCNSFTSI